MLEVAGDLRRAPAQFENPERKETVLEHFSRELKVGLFNPSILQ